MTTENERKSQLTIGKIAVCAIFTALIAVGAFIKIPVPVCPFTLQTLFVALAGLMLGEKYGALSAAAYLALGLIGIPIFTQGGGIYYIFKPTFGYIIGFCLGAYVTGRIARGTSIRGMFVRRSSNPSFGRLFAAALAGIACVYLVGVPYYYLLCNLVINSPIAIGTVMLYCFLLTLPGDILSCVIAALLAKRTLPILRKNGLI